MRPILVFRSGPSAGTVWPPRGSTRCSASTPVSPSRSSRSSSTCYPEDRQPTRRALQRRSTKDDYWPSIASRCPTAANGGSPRTGESRAAGRQAVRMLGVCIDVSTRKQNEVEILRLRAELAHAGRMSTMAQLASGLAHELNQPLGAILRNAEAAELFLQTEPAGSGRVARHPRRHPQGRPARRRGHRSDAGSPQAARPGTVELDVAEFVDEVLVLVRRTREPPCAARR